MSKIFHARDKLGRNAPCFCGSGKKYKRCCLQNERVKQVSKEAAFTPMENIGIVKMSEVILDFAEELLASAMTPKAQENAITIAIMAWNLALIEEPEREQQRVKIFRAMKIENNIKKSGDLKNTICYLIEKKQLLYPEINRFIVDYQFTKIKNGFHLNILSLISAEEIS